MNVKTAIKKINQAIKNRIVLELIYLLDDGTKMYFAVAPVCIKEYGGRQYLMSLDYICRAFAFDIERIDSMGEYWADYTLAENFNMELFENKVFQEGKHIDGYIFYEKNRIKSKNKRI